MTSWSVEEGLVVENARVGPDVGRMVVRSPRIAGAAQPGQFLMIRCWEGEPLLPRAMAPISYDPNAGTIEIFYRIMGPGTEAMAAAGCETTAHLTGPLGRPVSADFEGRNVALVGRGVGITPLLPLARRVVAAGGRIATYLSARRADYLFGLSEFESLGSVSAMTDEQGYADEVVTSRLEDRCKDGEVDLVYVCGSRRLIRHAALLGEEHGFEVYVFLEEKMGCGVGYCKGCPIKLRDGEGYRLVCVDGPTFPVNEVVLP